MNGVSVGDILYMMSGILFNHVIWAGASGVSCCPANKCHFLSPFIDDGFKWLPRHAVCLSLPTVLWLSLNCFSALAFVNGPAVSLVEHFSVSFFSIKRSYAAAFCSANTALAS